MLLGYSFISFVRNNFIFVNIVEVHYDERWDSDVQSYIQKFYIGLVSAVRPTSVTKN